MVALALAFVFPFAAELVVLLLDMFCVGNVALVFLLLFVIVNELVVSVLVAGVLGANGHSLCAYAIPI